MSISRTFIYISIFILVACSEKPEQQQWEQKANGVWVNTIGIKGFNSLDAAKAVPNLVQINKSEEVPFPLDKESIEISKQNNKLYLRFPLEKSEQIYGLGLQFKNVNRTGKVYNLQVDHYGGKDNGRTHAPIPFYISSKGYGVLVNTAKPITVYVGTTNRVDSPNPPKVYDRNTDKNWDGQPDSDIIEMVIPDSNAELIVFAGKSPMEIVQKYNLYSGGGCLPPKWGLGFTYRTHTMFSADQVNELVTDFEVHEFPLDFIGLEPGWMNRSYPCSYEWDKDRFPEPKNFVKGLLDKGVRTNLWINPYVAPQAALYDQLLPFSGTHTVWNGIVPDYITKGARQVFTDFYKENQLDIGVSGLKIDEVDGHDKWLWPDTASFPSGIDAVEMRQTYGLVIQEMVTEMYREKNERTYGLVRASNTGASRFPFVLYNDYYNHEDFITALINSGFIGVLWTPEVRQSATGEEWLRRMQSVCFSPMAMINAWQSGTKPWSYPEVYPAVKEIAQLRMQLLPYIYSTFAEYYFEGTPPIRPMALVEGFVSSVNIKEGVLDDTLNPYKEATEEDINDQYMFGENILVAPVFTGQTSRRVILPKGKWYDFYSGVYVGENEIIQMETKLEEIPLFVKDGGVIPMIQPLLHMPKSSDKLALEVRYYGKKEGSFLLYDDDGETFNYEKGDYSLTKLTVENTIEKEKQGEVLHEFGEIFHYSEVSWKFMTK